MPSRGQSPFDSQADFDALATLANDKLLPLVNEAIAGGYWPPTPYDIYSSGDYPTGTLANPQPDYAFDVLGGGVIAELNRIRGDYWNLIFGQYDIHGNLPLQDTLGTGLFLSPDNIVSGPWIVGVNDTTSFPCQVGAGVVSYQDDGLGNGQTTFLFESNFPGLNFDYYNALFDQYNNFSVYKNVSFIAKNLDASAGSGMSVATAARISCVCQTDNNNFDGANSDKLSISIDAGNAGVLTGKIAIWFCYSTSGPGNINPPDITAFTLSVSGITGVTWETIAAPFKAEVNGGGYIGSGEGVVVNWWRGTQGTQYQTYYLIANLNCPVDAGTTDVVFSIKMPAGFNFMRPTGFVADPLEPGTPAYALINCGLLFAQKSTSTPVNVLCPDDSGVMVAAPDFPDDTTFTIKNLTTTNDSKTCYMTNPATEGVWVANTLPVPANNTFISQDIPPYIGQTYENYGASLYSIGVSGTLLPSPISSLGTIDNPTTTQPDNNDPSYLDSMRQSAVLYRREVTEIISGFTVDLGPEYNLIHMSCQAQGAQWLTRRNTDFVPYDFGFNSGNRLIYPNNVALKDGSLNYFSFDLSSTPDAILCRIRCVQAGTATGQGWINGQPSWGTPLTGNMMIYFSNSASVYPDPANPATIAYSVSGNFVDIWKNLPAHLLALAVNRGGFNFAIQNTDPSTDVHFDIFLETDTVIPKRVYTPAINECFSFALNGNPWLSQYQTNSTNEIGKPIPQNGYCIYKIRAMRLPVKNSAGEDVTPSSGDALTIILGQNRQNYDGTLFFAPFTTAGIIVGAGDTNTGAGDSGTTVGGSVTPFTITIPANAGDSGFVEVFIPVLSGNELVWQCDEAIKLETWANWQPIWFSANYQVNNFSGTRGFDIFGADIFPSCLDFANYYYMHLSNLKPDGSTVSRALWPLSVDVYNDLNACLNLIP